MANNISITPLIPTEIQKTLSQVGGFIPNFDSQLIDSTKQKLILGAQNIVKNQNENLKNLIKKQKQVVTEQASLLRKAERDFKNKKITEGQLTAIRDNVKSNLEDIKLTTNNNIQQIQENKKI
jgi:hypothetical protein